MPSASTATRSETRFYLFEVIADLAKMARRSGDWSVAIHLEAILAAEELRDGRIGPLTRSITRGQVP